MYSSLTYEDFLLLSSSFFCSIADISWNFSTTLPFSSLISLIFFDAFDTDRPSFTSSPSIITSTTPGTSAPDSSAAPGVPSLLRR